MFERADEITLAADTVLEGITLPDGMVEVTRLTDGVGRFAIYVDTGDPLDPRALGVGGDWSFDPEPSAGDRHVTSRAHLATPQPGGVSTT